jgi:Mrp family chromosome partitioning ATPase
MNIQSLDRLGDLLGKPADRVSRDLRSDPMFVEQFKTLSSRFAYRIDALQYKVIAVTSAIAGEGKTVTAVTLATDLASSGRKKVLLVDVDLRKCDLAKRLHVPEGDPAEIPREGGRRDPRRHADRRPLGSPLRGAVPGLPEGDP